MKCHKYWFAPHTRSYRYPIVTFCTTISTLYWGCNKTVIIYHFLKICSNYYHFLELNSYWLLFTIDFMTGSSPTFLLQSNSLVCIKNYLFIVGIGPIINKELEFIYRSGCSDCTCVYGLSVLYDKF